MLHISNGACACVCLSVCGGGLSIWFLLTVGDWVMIFATTWVYFTPFWECICISKLKDTIWMNLCSSFKSLKAFLLSLFAATTTLSLLTQWYVTVIPNLCKCPILSY